MINRQDKRIAKEMQLSKNFVLWELIRSEHLDLVEIPIREIIRRLELGANMLLQPIRDKFGRTRVNSGYRSSQLNRAIGGSDGSDHIQGIAFDITPLESNLFVVFGWCCANLYYRQIIIYPDKKFLHVSYNFITKPYKSEIMQL